MAFLSVVHRFFDSCRRFPDNPAVFVNKKVYSYSEFQQLVSSVYCQIRNVETPVRLIGILAEENISTYASLFAVLSKGYGYVPLNVSNPVERNLEIITDSQINTLCVSKKSALTNEIEKYLPELKIIETENFIDSENLSQCSEIDENQIVYMIYTSGSTGKPKGVPIYHRNLSGFVEHMINPVNYDFNQNDRFLQMFEITFDASLMSMYVALSIGASFYVVPKKGVLNFNIFIMLEEHQITVANVVPSLLAYLKPYFHEFNLPSLRYFMSGGEALYDDITRDFYTKCVPNAIIENLYGPTEATIFCLTYRWNSETSSKELHKGVIPIGKTMNGTVALIVDENGNEMTKGEKGELCLGGVQVTDKYWNDELKTERAFFEMNINGKNERLYRTGDLCFVNEYGNFMFSGRIDNQVKIDGYRVELGEIEYHVKEIIKSDNIAALAIENKTGTMQIHLATENIELDLNDLTDKLKQFLPYYMLPSEIHFFKPLPLNTNGKTDRKKLTELIKTKISSLQN